MTLFHFGCAKLRRNSGSLVASAGSVVLGPVSAGVGIVVYGSQGPPSPHGKRGFV